MTGLSRSPVSARHRAQERRRAGAAHRDRRARLRPRGAQRALGAFAAALRCRLRRQDVRCARRRSSRSSRSGAGGSTAFAGATGSIIPPRRPGTAVAPLDQVIGTGDGATTDVPARQDLWRGLCALSAADRQAGAGSVRVAVAGSRGRRAGTAFTCDTTTGDRDVSCRPYAGGRARRSPPDSCSTCRCASTPTISKSISRPSRPARSRKFRWWRSSHENDSVRLAGQTRLRRHDAVPLLDRHARATASCWASPIMTRTSCSAA